MLHPPSALEAVRHNPQATLIPVVADANILIKDVCANLRRSRTTALLGLLLEGRIRVLITDRVAHEVPTRMGRVARENVDDALAVWNDTYLPLVRVVQVSELEAEPELAPLLEGVRAEDPDDVPTAYLGLLCAPCAVISEDSDLLDHGFGAREWVSTLRASGELGDLDLRLFHGANATVGLIQVASIGIFRVARLTASSPVAAGLLVALLAIGLADGRPAVAAQIQRVKPPVDRVVGGFGGLLEGIATQRAGFLDALSPATLTPASNAPLVAHLAAHLATSVDPLSIAELSVREGREPVEVGAALRGHPAFESVNGRGWQLGNVVNAPMCPARQQ